MVFRWFVFLAAWVLIAPAFVFAQEHGQDAQCIIVGDTAATLAPGLDEKEARAALATLPTGSEDKYFLNGRWTRTATNTTVNPRTPFTLTYSFVPDGTLATASGQTGVSSFFATTNAQFPGGSSAFKDLVRQALQEWGNLSGITYVETVDDGAPLPSSAGQLGVRGDVRISMYGFGGSNNGFLAFNSFPNQGDLVMNANYMQIWYAVPTNNFRRLRNTVAHEHGHGLGFSHVIPLNTTKLMESTITDFYDGLTEDEKRGLPRQYGDWAEVNDTIETARNLGALQQPNSNGAVFTTVQNLALEGFGANDFYRFNIPGFTRLTVRAIPLGTTYQSGPSGGSVATIDALRIQNLRLEIFSPNGTILQTAGSAPSGSPEEISNFLLVEPGGYHVRVSATDGADDVQRYELQLGYTFEPAATITLSRQTISAQALLGQNAADTTLGIRNTGQGNLDFSVASDVPWMSADPATGRATTSEILTTIHFATSSLAAGDYTGHLTVSAPNATNAPQVVTVSLRVAPPTLSVDKPSLNLLIAPGKNVAPQTITLRNIGLGSVNYTLSENSSLISLNPTSGSVSTENDPVTVSFATSALAVGSYDATIQINSNSSTGAISIPVRVTVSTLNGWALIGD